ncbi:hypothetical protein [Streptomyces sp. ODS28]|uniref:hypothetical protein n=1 Tax=Streptomyces sp. ODS28 TaxID=3136688 RepID=UPI0031EF8BD6
MTDILNPAAVTGQKASASGNASITQVSGDYERHEHRYVRGWEYLGGVGVDEREWDLAAHAFVDVTDSSGSRVVERAVRQMRARPGHGGVLVLIGEASTGRRAAALRLLHELDVPRERVRWLVPDWEQPLTERVPHTDGHGFILDLNDSTTLPETFYTGLSDYRRVAESSGTYLVMLVSPGRWKPEGLVTVPEVTLRRPQAPEIATTHLRHLAPAREEWLTQPPLNGLLQPTSPPADAARLARLVIRAGETDDREKIKAEFTGWHDYLQGWFEKHAETADLRERALLIAAALLEGVPVHTVLEAADKLFQQVGGSLPVGGPLAGRDLTKRLEAIKASSAAAEAISLDKDRHGLSEATLKYVWLQRPQLRKTLLQWASDLSGPGGIAVKHLHRIAASLVQLSLLPGGNMVQTVAIDWIGTGRTTHRDLAVEVLEAMALHPVTGPGLRKNLYDWAHQSGTSEQLAAAIAQISAGHLGQKFPRIALTRLRLLASRPDGLARDAIAEAVRDLAANHLVRPLVLAEVTQWLGAKEESTRRAGAEAFLALTDLTMGPPPLLTAAQDAEDEEAAEEIWQMLVRGWRAALAQPDTCKAACDRLAAWLDSAELPDQHVLRVATEVLHQRLAASGPAAVLVGHDVDSELGRTRRAELVRQLFTPHSSTPATPPDPSPGPASQPAHEEGPTPQ